jgi:hypothetical protein
VRNEVLRGREQKWRQSTVVQSKIKGRSIFRQYVSFEQPGVKDEGPVFEFLKRSVKNSVENLLNEMTEFCVSKDDLGDFIWFDSNKTSIERIFKENRAILQKFNISPFHLTGSQLKEAVTEV